MVVKEEVAQVWKEEAYQEAHIKTEQFAQSLHPHNLEDFPTVSHPFLKIKCHLTTSKNMGTVFYLT